MRRSCSHSTNPVCLLRLLCTITCARVGELPRNLRHHPLFDTVFSSNLHYLHVEDCGESEYTDDVHTDPRELRMGCQSGCATRTVWVECMGRLLCDWVSTRHAVGNGKLFRDHEQEAREAGTQRRNGGCQRGATDCLGADAIAQIRTIESLCALL